MPVIADGAQGAGSDSLQQNRSWTACWALLGATAVLLQGEDSLARAIADLGTRCFQPGASPQLLRGAADLAIWSVTLLCIGVTGGLVFGGLVWRRLAGQQAPRSRLLALGVCGGLLCLLGSDLLELASTVDGMSLTRAGVLMRRALGLFCLAGAVLGGAELWAARRVKA